MSDFGDAVCEMREGGKVRRAGWREGPQGVGSSKWLTLDGAVVCLEDRKGKTPWLDWQDDSVEVDLLADDWEGVD